MSFLPQVVSKTVRNSPEPSERSLLHNQSHGNIGMESLDITNYKQRYGGLDMTGVKKSKLLMTAGLASNHHQKQMESFI